jgi:hypothetical protein
MATTYFNDARDFHIGEQNLNVTNVYSSSSSGGGPLKGQAVL